MQAEAAPDLPSLCAGALLMLMLTKPQTTQATSQRHNAAVLTAHLHNICSMSEAV
jgi:hypothetical protein